MKHIRLNFLKYAVMACSMILLCACPDDEPDTLSVTPTRLSFTADDTKEEVITVTTNVDTWLAEISNGWVRGRKENDKLYIQVEKYNETGDPRQAEITIIAGSADPVSIKVTQSARNSLSVSPESLSFEADETGGKTIAIVTSAQSWDATTDASSWISLGKQGNTLTVNVSSDNTGSSPRTATITITAGNALVKTVTVTQASRHTLSASPSSLSFTSDETGEQTVAVSTTAPVWNVTTTDSWITPNKQNNTLGVRVSKNTGTSDRNANVTITAGNALPVTVSVTQAAFAVPNGNYTAYGTPIFSSGPTSWSGRITNSSSRQFITITNWGNESISVWCDYKDGKIIMDGATPVAEDGDVEGYFRACAISGEYIIYNKSTTEYVVNYNSATRTLDFSGTISGLPASVGVLGFYKSTGELAGRFTDIYENARLVLTSTSSSPQFGGDAIIPAEELKKYKVREASILEMTNNTTGSSVEKQILKKESLKILKSK